MRSVGRALLFLIAALNAGCGQVETQQPAPEAVKAARAASGDLGRALMGRLTTALSDSGPEAAVAVCAIEAQEIAEEVSAQTGLDVGRTALRTRNLANRPDDWEQKQLLAFEAGLKKGADPKSLEVAEMTETPGGAVFRWAKPIMTQQLCLTCHGASIAPDLAQVIDDLYPSDAARGFEIGQMRGIFTVSNRVTRDLERR